MINIIKKNINHPTINKVVKNITWLFFDKILKLALGLVVVIFLARYLEPEGFGLYHFVISLVTIFAAFASLGLYAVVVRELINRQEKEKILFNAFVLMLVASVVAYAIMYLTISLLRPNDLLTKFLVVLLGTTLIFKSATVVKYWFEALILSKYTVYVESSVFFIGALLKLILVYYQASLTGLILVLVLESILIFIGLFWVYWLHEKKLPAWRFDFSETKYLLTQSWPLIISGAAWIIYTKIDQIMIGQMINDAAVGHYAAASKLSEIAAFLPAIIAFSIIPAIMKYRDINNQHYKQRFQQIYNIVVTLMVIAAIFVTYSAGYIINILYGEDYSDSTNVLVIQFWIVIFIAMAAVSGKYYVNEGLQKLTMQRHILGVVINIPLNLLLIPLYSIEGAAIASLISMIIANYLYDLKDKRTRIVFIQKSNAILFLWLFTGSITSTTRGKKNGK